MSIATNVPAAGVLAHTAHVLHETFAILGAAIRASSALERRSVPAAADLKTLGMSPENFPKF